MESVEAICVNGSSDEWMNWAPPLTDALGADLAVTFRTLAGEAPHRVDALLAGLTVVLVTLTFIHVCVKWGEGGEGGGQNGDTRV